MRDQADIYQLIVLVNLESMNAELIKMNMSQPKRLEYLNRMAINQMRALVNNNVKNLQRLLGEDDVMAEVAITMKED